LAAALSGFASSPYGLIVKSINVDVAGTLPTEMAATPPPIVTPAYVPQPTMSQEAMDRARYGDAMAGRYGQRYGEGSGKFPGYPTQPQPQYVQPVAAAKKEGGLPVVVDEKQLKVTMQLVAVKMINTNFVAAK
jgi:hypothetical protein